MRCRSLCGSALDAKVSGCGAALDAKVLGMRRGFGCGAARNAAPLGMRRRFGPDAALDATSLEICRGSLGATQATVDTGCRNGVYPHLWGNRAGDGALQQPRE